MEQLLHDIRYSLRGAVSQPAFSLTAGPGSRGASRTLVVAEVALALVLVIGAGLMVKSLLRLQNEPSGFTAEGVFTFNISLPQAKYADAAPREFYRRLLEEIRTVPGVQSAAAINYAPMTNFGFNGPFSVKGQPPFEPGKAPVTEYRLVSPGYFSTMGIPIVRGTDFTPQHNENERPVAIINETIARQHFGGANPIGTHIQLGVDAQATWREVIGVAGDVRDNTLGNKPVPESFIAGSLLLTRALDTLLYEVSPTDPLVLAMTCAGVLAIAMVASLVPALRALGVDPMVALRAE